MAEIAAGAMLDNDAGEGVRQKVTSLLNSIDSNISSRKRAAKMVTDFILLIAL